MMELPKTTDVKKEKTIYDLELHEWVVIGGASWERVPGGWIFCMGDENTSPTFIPYNEEFK